MHNCRGQGSVGLLGVILVVIFLVFFLVTNFPMLFSLEAVIAVIVFLIAFFNTEAALVIIIFSMLLSPEISAGAISGRFVAIRAEDILLLVVVFGWFAKMAVKKELGFLKNTALNQPIIVYTFVCFIASLFGILGGHLQFKSSIFYVLKYIEYFLLFFMVVNNIKTQEQAKRFVFFILLVCVLVCVYAWLNPQAGRLSAPFEGEGGEPNTFSGYLILIMGILLGLFFYSASLQKQTGYAGVFILAFATFVMTLSRGGWLSFIPMLLVFIVLNRKWRPLLLLLLCTGLLFLPILTPQVVKNRIQDTFVADKSYRFLGKTISVSESTAARIDSWSFGMSYWAKGPILGHGIPAGSVVDNQYIRVFIETGVVGVLAASWVILGLFQAVLRIFKFSARDNFTRGLSLGFLAAFVGLMVHAFSAATFIIIRIMEPFWFIAAIIIMLPELPANSAEENES